MLVFHQAPPSTHPSQLPLDHPCHMCLSTSPHTPAHTACSPLFSASRFLLLLFKVIFPSCPFIHRSPSSTLVSARSPSGPKLPVLMSIVACCQRVVQSRHKPAAPPFRRAIHPLPLPGVGPHRRRGSVRPGLPVQGARPPRPGRGALGTTLDGCKPRPPKNFHPRYFIKSGNQDPGGVCVILLGSHFMTILEFSVSLSQKGATPLRNKGPGDHLFGTQF